MGGVPKWQFPIPYIGPMELRPSIISMNDIGRPGGVESRQRGSYPCHGAIHRAIQHPKNDPCNIRKTHDPTYADGFRLMPDGFFCSDWSNIIVGLLHVIISRCTTNIESGRCMKSYKTYRDVSFERYKQLVTSATKNITP